MVEQKTIKKHTLKIIYIFVILTLILTLYFSTNNCKIKCGFRTLIRWAENKIVLYKTRNFNEAETDNFIFKYENIEEQTLQLIKKVAEEKYKETTDIFQYKLKDKILVVVYDDIDLMMNTTMLKRGNPPIGVYYGNSVHILNPTFWIEDSNSLEYIFCKEGPMLHELVHLFTDHIGRGNFPMWFTEGVSLYFEYVVDGYEWGREVESTNKYTVEELNDNFYSLNQYEAYTASFRLVKDMVNNYSLNKLIDVITLLGKGHNIYEFAHLFEGV